MSVGLDTSDLLRYDTAHCVVICRECKYAIQKGALDSHLLRHKIYRGERHRLLSSISQLPLLEPDEVQLPSPGSPPVEGLPVFSGYRCSATGCPSLYASTKRMRRHWSESHGVSDPPTSCAEVTQLQTFFRGTKLRYFEVALAMPTAITEETSVQQHNSSLELRPDAHPQASSLDLDMGTIRYFHHFMTTTSLTLLADSPRYWQTDVVAQALQQSWLLCGLLAVSANHLAAASDDEETRRAHLEHWAQYLRGFQSGWSALPCYTGVAGVEEGIKFGAQLRCIHGICQWVDESPALGQATNLDTPFQLQSFMTNVQGCVDSEFALRFAADSKDMTEELFVQARNGSREVPRASGVHRSTPPALLARFRSLPYRMAEALQKPDNATDLFATLSAIDTLVECCAKSYASNDLSGTWTSMEMWLWRVPDHFNRILWHRSAAGLIVLAHWTLLVERAESYCWFLKGAAAKMRRQIALELPDVRSIHSLIENLAA